jgi:hypothetical protein
MTRVGRDQEGLLTVRATVVLMLALVVGLGAGYLSYLADHDPATAILVGGSAAGAALLLFHNVVDK